MIEENNNLEAPELPENGVDATRQEDSGLTNGHHSRGNDDLLNGTNENANLNESMNRTSMASARVGYSHEI